ncbi:hypothetical protein CYMTET_12212 [Cymbomonas tetramitiformis]|uniref:AAA+ ATPase domain-containing protein n=1 Tax=Cymbomonas tetramitiformis TaxID=36881 RepID=A0AAE0LC26_9CHLO|nr:hypothetical protein CYMTET_12212 [Cymbomonas tetramitiformis]
MALWQRRMANRFDDYRIKQSNARSRDHLTQCAAASGDNSGTTDRSDRVSAGDSGSEPSKSPFTRFFRWIVAIRESITSFLSEAIGRFLRSSRIQQFQFFSLLSLGALVGVRLMSRHNAPPPPRPVIYSEFIRNVKQGEVTTVRFQEASKKIYFELSPTSGKVSVDKAPVAKVSAESVVCVTSELQGGSQKLFDLLDTKEVEYGAITTPLSASLTKALTTIFLLWVPLVPLFFMMRGMMNRGSKGSNFKRDAQEAQRVTFDDVAGVDIAKAELEEIVACLQDAERYQRLKAKLPSGVLLVGPPGTGKTLLAKAVAGEAGIPFFAASASEFVEMFVGRGAARVRDLFAHARKHAPSVIFIDELDAIGGSRGAGLNEERDQTLNQLLTEMDGFHPSTGVLVLAATNRPEVLDSALLRPGRISRTVVVDRPDASGRQDIMLVHLQNVPVRGEVGDLAEAIARISQGFAGADLANVVNEGVLLAARKGKDEVELADLVEAVQRSRFGVGGSFNIMGSVSRWFQYFEHAARMLTGHFVVQLPTEHMNVC